MEAILLSCGISQKYEVRQQVIIMGEDFPFYTGRIGMVTKCYVAHGAFTYKVRFDIRTKPLFEPKRSNRKSMYEGYPSNIQYKVFNECELVPFTDIAKVLYCD